MGTVCTVAGLYPYSPSPPLPFFVSADSKGVTGVFFVSADSKELRDKT